MVVILGAGGIGRAAALLLLGERDVPVRLVDAAPGAAAEAAAWATVPGRTPPEALTVDLDGADAALAPVFHGATVVLDCLPGRFAPRMASRAFAAGAAYANLTEYVPETRAVLAAARAASATAVIQTGLAPGYIDVLGMAVLAEFEARHGVSGARRVGLRVGALTATDVPDVHYGWTWSTIGVATEYVGRAVALRGGRVVELPSLSEREPISIGGTAYEADLTAGGAADLPDALAGRVEDLDYKTVRYPGHYAWVDAEIAALGPGPELAQRLEQAMLAKVPVVEDDRVVLAAFVEGADRDGVERRLVADAVVGPYQASGRRMRAIQSTTAAPLVQVALDLLDGKLRGVVTQSMLGADFLAGGVIRAVYGAPAVREG